MNKQSPFKVILQDPLNEATRRQRRTLLGLSVVAHVIVWAKLIPKKIEVLGVDLPSEGSQVLLVVLLVALIYSAVMFIVYARSDWYSWKMSIGEAEIEDKMQEYYRDWDLIEVQIRKTGFGLDTWDGRADAKIAERKEPFIQEGFKKARELKFEKS